MKTARDMMSSPVITLSRTSTVLEAARLLLDKRLSGAPVLDPRGRAEGVFTLRDLAKFFLDPKFDEAGKAADATVPISDFMTHHVVTVKPEATIEELRRTLKTKKVHRLFVEDPQGNLIGVVSVTDLATKNV